MPDSSGTVTISLNLKLVDHLRSDLFRYRLYYVSNVLLFIAIIAAPAAVISIFDRTGPPLLIVFLFSLVIGVAPAIFGLLRVCFLWFRGRLPKQIVLTATDKGVTYQVKGDKKERRKWNEIYVYEQSKRFFVPQYGYYLPLPKRGFTAEQIAVFSDLLNRNLEMDE
jgi:hypothetical protein